MQEWYAKRERKLLDGIFTGEEIMWLLTPTEFRPAQYRPDIVVRLHEALRPENLWAEDYEPSPVQRNACRILSRIVRQASEEIAAERDAEIKDSVDPDEATEDAPAPAADFPVPIPSFAGAPVPDGEDECFMVTS
jgi:hypothetical protein